MLSLSRSSTQFQWEHQRLRTLSRQEPNGDGTSDKKPTFPYKKACPPSNLHRKTKPVSRLMRKASNILVSQLGRAMGG